ncbi:MAG: hypothetical protein LBQ83_00505 [Candidatus Margulisbacteria bacterium]|jgi:predicted transposase/invertase (TIGR01784 family)|nr:hypothetical protein [Candidatus Margulisiibacteriota bacterium]
MKIDKAIQEAQRKIAYASNDDGILHAYQMREIGLSDWNSRLGDAKREGLKEGAQEGRTEALKDAARKMKKSGMPATQISEYTGLSSAEIDKL